MLIEIDESQKNLYFSINLWSESCFDDIYFTQIHWNAFCKYDKL